MLNYRQRVMEDLDALLADLQSTTAHISSFQQQVERDQANQRSNTASSQSSPRNSTPSPLPPHPSGEQIAGRPGVKQHIIQENSSHQQQQHSYSSERVSSGSSTATYHQERSSSSSTHSQSSLQGVSPVHYNSKPLSSPSNNTSVGSNTISQMSSTVNSNLSELDQLLQDLNSAQFIDQVNRRNASTNQNQMVNGNSQRVVSAPVPPSPTSTTVPPGQPPVGPKPTRVESSNRCQMNPLLHEMENVVPPPMGDSEIESETEQCPPRPPLPRRYKLRQLSHGRRRSSSRESPGSRRRHGGSSPTQDGRRSEMVFSARAAAVIGTENVPRLDSQAPYFPDCCPADIDTSISVYSFESGIDVQSFSQSSIPLEIDCLQEGEILIPLLDENSSSRQTTKFLETKQAVQDGTVHVEDIKSSQVETCKSINDLGGEMSSHKEGTLEQGSDVFLKMDGVVSTENRELQNQDVQVPFEEIPVESEITKNERAVVVGEPEFAKRVSEIFSPEILNYQEECVAILYEHQKMDVAMFPEEFDLPEEQTGLLVEAETEDSKECLAIVADMSASSEIVPSKEVPLSVEPESSKESNAVVLVQVETSKGDSLDQAETFIEECITVPVTDENHKDKVITASTEAEVLREKFIPIPVKVETSEEGVIIPIEVESSAEEGVIIPIEIESSAEEGVIIPVEVETSEEESMIVPVETSENETLPAPVEVEIPIAQEIRIIVATKELAPQSTIEHEMQNDASALVIRPKSSGTKLPIEILLTTAESAVSSSSSSTCRYSSATISSVAHTTKAPVSAPPAVRPRALPIDRPIFVDVSHTAVSRPPPPPPSQTITRSLGGSSPPVPPFPVFLNLDDPLLKQGVPSASSDCNYSYQSSEYKTSSSTCSTLDRESTLGRGSGFSVHDGHVSAFTPLQPMSHAVGMPDVAEQQHSTSSHSYSKTESMESKSETFQKNQQTKMEHTEQYAAASSSSFSSSSYSSQQQHQQACSQPPPQLMVMDQNQMTPPAAFPLPPDYELKPSEQSHIYKKIERNEPAKSFDGNLQLSQENRDIVTGQEIPISQQFESSVSEQQSQALSEQQSSVTSEVTERTSTSSNVEMEASSASTTATTATITSTTTTTTCTTTTSSTSLHAPPSPTPPFSKVFLQLRKDSGEYDVLPGNTEVNYSQESEDYDLANSFGFQPIADDKELQNSLEWQSRQMSGTSSAVTSTQLQQQQQQMNSQSYVQNAYPQTQSHYQEIPTHAPQTASTATRELDELMASLSEFRMTNRDTSSTTTQHAGSAGGDPAYAGPHKNRSPVGAATPASAVNMGSGGAAAHGDQLDSMLGSLQSDMNRQGVSTKTKGLCAACNKPVVSQMITALGKVWHVEHFTCAHCKMTLGTMSFYEREGKAYCEQDYHNLFAPRCAYCSGPITDKCVTALDKTWHPEHFFCGFCGCNFGDQGFHERDGQAYCREDFLKMFAPKCGGCGQPINDSYISALNRHWHPECFVCWDCQRPFGNMSFFDHDGLPYCEQHYHAKRGSLCADCQQPITGPSIIAMGRKFHPKHFTCAFCLKQLNNVTFKEQNNKPYCHPCFSKLFAGTKMMD